MSLKFCFLWQSILRTFLALFFGFGFSTWAPPVFASGEAITIDQVPLGDLPSDHPYQDWIQGVLPLVLFAANKGSGFIFGQATDGRTLIGSASHVIQPAWNASAGRPEQLHEKLVLFSWPYTVNFKNRSLKSELIYMPAWDASTFPEDGFGSIALELDLALGVTQAVELPQRYQHQPIIAEVPQQGVVLGVGHPLEYGAKISVTVGRVLSDIEGAEFRQKYTPLALRDIEHQPIDAKVSFVVLAKATVGMSGGPVFDSAGNLIGMMVSSGTTAQGQEFFVALKATWIAETAHQKLGELIPKPIFSPMGNQGI